MADMQAAARKRTPKFAYDYLVGGIGRETALATNRAALDAVKLVPRYLCSDADTPDCSQTLLDKTYDLPVGVAPMGFSGLIWPRAAEYLASAAQAHNIPFTLSGYATTNLEDIAALGCEHRWYQHHVPVDEGCNRDIIERARHAGYDVLVVTVDVPTAARRDQDIKNGLSVPPRFDWRTVLSVLARPRWALETLRAGIPAFENIVPYMPKGVSLEEIGVFISEFIERHVSLERLQRVREQWPGKMIVKGILDPAEAVQCQRIGIDAVVVSNHGGRQLDAAPSAITVLPAVREAVGPDYPLLADGGTRNGLDVARFLARGADFVLLGRAFMYATAALGEAGGGRLLNILKEEFRSLMAQIGCPRIAELPRFLAGPANVDSAA